MGNNSSNPLISLDDGDDDGKAFDQFKGKKTTYKDELYTTRIDEALITKEIREMAELKEKEIIA